MIEGIHLTVLIGTLVPEAAPPAVVRALTKARVTTSSNRSGFQLTFSLSREAQLERELLPGGFFDPMRRVILVATVRGRPEVLIDGVITQQEVTPGSSPGESTLSVTGDDLTRVMDLIDLTGVPYPMPFSARVIAILARYAHYGLIPKVIPSPFVYVPIPTEKIPKQRGTDLQYIRRMARETGYAFYVEPGPEPGLNVAYWGPEIRVGSVQPALNVNMDAHTNVESLSFSYDGMAHAWHVVFVHNQLTKVPIPIPIPDIVSLSPPLAKKPPIPLRVEQADDFAKLTPPEAVGKALGMVANSSDAVTATGQLDVLRYGQVLKARQLVGVRGAGVAYDGQYYVKNVTCDIEPGQFKQSFTLSRDGLISLHSEVPA